MVMKEEAVFEQVIGNYKISMHMTCIRACPFFLTVCLEFDILAKLIYPINKNPSTGRVRSSLVILYVLQCSYLMSI